MVEWKKKINLYTSRQETLSKKKASFERTTKKNNIEIATNSWLFFLDAWTKMPSHAHVRMNWVFFSNKIAIASFSILQIEYNLEFFFFTI
jgi:hypothetical protein